jgi:CSLREA domain-containing protein
MIRTNDRVGLSAAAVTAGALAVSLLVLLLWAALPAQAQSATAAATITVNTKKDETTPGDNRCSLREAIQNANDNAQTSSDCNVGSGEDNITFRKGLSGTIRLDLSQGPLTITDPAKLTINGGKENITVSGDDKVQVFSVSQGAKLAVKQLTVARGFRINTPQTNPQTDGLGGGIKNDGGTLTVTRSTFLDNNANVGGGIANANGGTLTVTNSTFSGNGAVVGGAMSNDGTLEVTYSTLSGNGADLGSGIQNAFVETAKTTLSSTVLANSKGNGQNCRGTITDGGYNISDDSSCTFTDSTSKNATDPELDPNGLQNNGGPTQTIALQQGSPAVDYIPEGENGCGTTIRTDQRGIKRPQGKTCDVGAYELK